MSTTSHPCEIGGRHTVGVDLGLRTLITATGPTLEDTLRIDGRPSWHLYEEATRYRGPDEYESLIDARIEQAADQLITFLDTRGTQTVAIESLSYPSPGPLSDHLPTDADAAAWILPRTRERVLAAARREDYRVVEVFPGGTSTTCHACDATGVREMNVFVCLSEKCGVGRVNADANSAERIATLAAKGQQIVGGGGH